MTRSAASEKRQRSVFVIAAWATVAAAAIAAAQLLLQLRSPSQVDHDLVGTWELPVPSTPGDPNYPADHTWIQTIEEDGGYLFTATGPPARYSWSAELTARDGRWTLRGDYDDRGTYELISKNELRMVGSLGTGLWKRRE